jgi:hypothetical protein
VNSEYQKGKHAFQEWLAAEKRSIEAAGLPTSQLREDMLWCLGVRKKNLPTYKSQYQPCSQAWIDELNMALAALGATNQPQELSDRWP